MELSVDQKRVVKNFIFNHLVHLFPRGETSYMIAYLFNKGKHGFNIKPANIGQYCSSDERLIGDKEQDKSPTIWRLKELPAQHEEEKPVFRIAEKKPETPKTVFGVLDGTELYSQHEDINQACSDAMDLVQESTGVVYVVKYIKKYKLQKVLVEDM